MNIPDSDVGCPCGIELANKSFLLFCKNYAASTVCNGLFVGLGQCTKAHVHVFAVKEACRSTLSMVVSQNYPQIIQ